MKIQGDKVLSNLDKIRLEILDAKEKRWLKQKALVSKSKLNLISFKFNIPSWPKKSSTINRTFKIALRDFHLFLDKKRVNYKTENSSDTLLGPETFLLSSVDTQELKNLAIDFEETHHIGRLLDLDVINTNGEALERKTKRQCYLCGEIAITCMRNLTHSPEELREYFDHKIREYLKS